MKKQPMKIFRIVMALTVLAAMVAMLPRPVQAASQWFEIVQVQADQSVKIYAHSFPANQIFTVRMDRSGNQGINGIVVTQTNTGAGGDFQETYKIPAELKGVQTITIRMESATGYFTYNWFNNASSTTPNVPNTGTTTTTTTTTGAGPNLSVSAVDASHQATIKVSGFPANQYFTVRVGPYWTFSSQYRVMATIYSGSGGSFSFNVDIPDNVKAGDLVAIRMDSPEKYFAYNAFKNVDTGTVSNNPNGSIVTNACEIISTAPSVKVAKGADFDAVWRVKNISGKTWDMNAVDYKYVDGRTFKADPKIYDLPSTVKDDKEIKITIDMVAPTTAGTYSTNWSLVQGSTTLCKLPLTITVK